MSDNHYCLCILRMTRYTEVSETCFFFSNENVIVSCFVDKQLKRKQEIACIDRWMNI